jgi:hypothetical protein
MALRTVLGILSPLPLTKREDGKLLLEMWRKYLPMLLPDKFGNWEPIDRPFDARNVEAALDAWKWPFLAVKNNPSVRANVWMRKDANQHLHSSWTFDLDPTAASQEDLLAFLKEACLAVKADFAYLHLLTRLELEQGRQSRMVHALDRKASKFHFAIYSKDLQQRIPDLLWATVLGSPYSEMFGRDRLSPTPAYISEPLSNEMVLLQMTPRLSDIEDRSDLFSESRGSVKAHLGQEAFFQPSHTGTYLTPNFKFP